MEKCHVQKNMLIYTKNEKHAGIQKKKVYLFFFGNLTASQKLPGTSNEYSLIISRYIQYIYYITSIQNTHLLYYHK